MELQSIIQRVKNLRITNDEVQEVEKKRRNSEVYSKKSKIQDEYSKFLDYNQQRDLWKEQQ